jgi:hypothetical protein
LWKTVVPQQKTCHPTKSKDGIVPQAKLDCELRPGRLYLVQGSAERTNAVHVRQKSWIADFQA